MSSAFARHGANGKSFGRSPPSGLFESWVYKQICLLLAIFAKNKTDFVSFPLIDRDLAHNYCNSNANNVFCAPSIWKFKTPAELAGHRVFGSSGPIATVKGDCLHIVGAKEYANPAH